MMRLPRFGLRTKLLLAGASLFAIPWAGYEFVQEMERFLRQGQEQSVAATAQAVATALHERPRLFEPQPGQDSAWHEPGDLYLFALPRAVEVDGAASDWPATIMPREFHAPVTDQTTTNSNTLRVRLGQHGAYLYALLEISDPAVHYRADNIQVVETADHVEFALTTPEGEFRRYAVSPQRPGAGTAHELQFSEGKLSLFRAESRIRSVWREISGGYTVELMLPMSLVGEHLSFAAANVAEAEAGVSAWINTSTVERRDGMGRLLMPSPEIQQVIQGLARAASRIRIVERNHRVTAEVGSLKQASPPQTSQGWLHDRVLRPLYARLLRQPSDNFRDDAANVTQLESKKIDAALRGVARLGRRQSTDGKAVIITAAHPIWVGDQVFGAVVVEETTNAVVSLRNQALEKLFTTVLVVFALVTLVLLAFATRLSWRIRKLRDEAEAAIDARGRVLGALRQSAQAGDEIGDLSRGFSDVLVRLGHYHHYLEQLASRLSHELRTPIAVVRSSLDNLAAEPHGKAAQVYLTRAQEGIARLNTILTRMTEARRLEQSLEQADKEHFDLVTVLAGCVEGYRLAFPACRFNTRIPADPVMVSGVPDLIAQALDKLVANAVDFHREGSSIDIALSPQEDHAVLTISNEGPSLPADMADQLFQSMVSVRAGQAEAEPHLGFGLYIVRLIAGFHGGEARIANRPDGAGVIATLTLPKAP